MANVKITDLTALSGALAGADLFEMVDDVAGTPTSAKVTAEVVREYMNMAYLAASPTTADVTGVINTLHALDISGLTATRNFVLPATAAVGDRVGVMITVTHATVGREIVMKGDTGDSILASGATYTAAEWSRIWQVGEIVVFRCTVADSTWIVEQDGRVPTACKFYLSTAADGETALTASIPTSYSGVWTPEIASGVVGDTANSKMTVRRAGRYAIMLKGRQKDNPAAAGDTFAVGLYINGTTTWKAYQASTAATTGDLMPLSSFSFADFAAGDYVVFHYVTTSGAKGMTAATSDVYSAFGLTEIL